MRVSFAAQSRVASSRSSGNRHPHLVIGVLDQKMFDFGHLFFAGGRGVIARQGLPAARRGAWGVWGVCCKALPCLLRSGEFRDFREYRELRDFRELREYRDYG